MLVDTSVWVDQLSRRNPTLRAAPGTSTAISRSYGKRIVLAEDELTSAAARQSSDRRNVAPGVGAP
jgi:hypothetical protein